MAVEVLAEQKEVPRLQWALSSVLKSMQWDEEEFGREYDLDAFRVVCVPDFNMGAMENKGLNVFNSSLLLADPRTTTGQKLSQGGRWDFLEFFLLNILPPS